MNPQINKMTSFMVMDVLEKANELQSKGISVIHMEVGEPDFNMPECIKKAEMEAVSSHLTHYTNSLGDPELREEISKFYNKEYGVNINPNCVLVTSGSSPAIYMTLMLLCEAGSEVIMPNPGYSCYKNFTLAVNANPVLIKLRADKDFEYNIEDIKKAITPKTRAIFINSPSNPLGDLLSEDFFKKVVKLGLPVLSDEIYHGIVYEKGKVHSIMEYSNDAFVFNGFSKRFAMTGLRLGYVIAPEKYMRSLQKIQQNLFICAPSTTQRAGVAALKYANPDVIKMRETYNKRRIYMIKRLKEMGLHICSEPLGAFYMFIDVRKYTSDSYKFAFDVLENAHVGVTPGVDFGSEGEGFIRLSYANSLENIKEGLNRLEKYFSSLKV